MDPGGAQAFCTPLQLASRLKIEMANTYAGYFSVAQLSSER